MPGGEALRPCLKILPASLPRFPLGKLLKGKFILVTGGTSTLGRAIVLKALQQEAIVSFTFHTQQDTARDLQQAGAHGYAVNLADPRAIDHFARVFKSQTPRLSALVHNAAAVRDRPLPNLSDADWDYVMAVNLKAPYYLTKKMLPLLFKIKPSKILFVTSRSAFRGAIGVANYASSKGGLIGLTKSLAQELGGKKVLVNALNPGFMKSAMTQHLGKEIVESNRAASPLHEISDPDEVAEFIIYLLSDHMNRVTGQVFHYESRMI